ncbi:MAG TPA: hypothetical protein VFW96_00830 [Thermomicrobiales bacterium]|nr:hypothetical protein [Thermomicrobiales bacterium]
MSVADAMLGLFRRNAQELAAVEVPAGHVEPGVGAPAPPAATALQGNDGYFQLWATSLFLQHDRDWFTDWYPVVQSAVSFRYADLPQPLEIPGVAGPGQLFKTLAPDNLAQVVVLDYPLTPLVPFRGGTVTVEVGLLAMRGADDYLRRFLDVIGDFASLVTVPQLSLALTVASKVGAGIHLLAGATGDHLAVGYQRTFQAGDGDGANGLRAAAFAVINGPRERYPADGLWVHEGRLHLAAPGAARAEPVAADHALFRIETRAERDDWDQLGAIAAPFARAMDALAQLDARNRPNVRLADAQITQAILATLQSPDLTERDRGVVAAKIRDRYKERKRVLLGDGDRVARAAGPWPPLPARPEDRADTLAAVLRAPGATRGVAPASWAELLDVS